MIFGCCNTCCCMVLRLVWILDRQVRTVTTRSAPGVAKNPSCICQLRESHRIHLWESFHHWVHHLRESFWGGLRLWMPKRQASCDKWPFWHQPAEANATQHRSKSDRFGAEEAVALASCWHPANSCASPTNSARCPPLLASWLCKTCAMSCSDILCCCCLLLLSNGAVKRRSVVFDFLEASHARHVSASHLLERSKGFWLLQLTMLKKQPTHLKHGCWSG